MHFPLHTSHLKSHMSHIFLYTPCCMIPYLTSRSTHCTHVRLHTLHFTALISHSHLSFFISRLPLQTSLSRTAHQFTRLTPHTSHLTPQTSQFTLHCTHRIFHWKMPSLITESCVPVIARLHLSILSIFILVASVRYWKAQSINTQIPIFRVVHHVCTASSYYCRATPS